MASSIACRPYHTILCTTESGGAKYLTFKVIKLSRRRVAMALPTSASGKTTLVLVSLATILLVVLAGVLLRDTQRRSARGGGESASKSGRDGDGVPETFETEPVPRHFKNDIYKEYIQDFFSNGDTTTSIMFSPSVVDIACVTMTEKVKSNVDCSSALLDSVSISDTKVIALPGHEGCSALALARQPLDHSDAEVRMLNGIFRFNKACITTPYLSLQQINGTSVRIEMLAQSPAALYIMLNRPVFVMTDASFLYRVVYKDKDEGVFYRGVNHRTFPGADNIVTLVLEQVRDTRIRNAENYGRKLLDLFPRKNGFLPLAIYFMRFVNTARIGISQVTYGEQNAVTLVFHMTSGLMSKDTWFSTEGTSTPGFSIGISGRDRNFADVRVSGAAESEHTVRVANRGYLVLVYSTNLLVLCYMSRDRCHIKRYGDVPPLVVGDLSRFQSAVDNAGVGVPAICFPNITFGIPNLYDMYTRLVAFS